MIEMRSMAVCGTAALLLLGSCTGDGTRSPADSQDPAVAQQGFVAAVERAVPAVVNIRTVTRFPHGRGGGGANGDATMQDYLAELLEENGGLREPPSLGSGVIVGEDGLIVTNEHVIRDAEEIVVRLSDRSEYRAKVVGADPRTDVALLRIRAPRKLPVAVLGDSSRIRVGDWAIAVGNPFGLESTVTLGVVSATGRTDLGVDPTGDLIQTDASINPGNSGGPLLNTRGEVVGINTAMVSGGQGIGFAIPINTVLEIERELARTGTIRRGWLGVGIQLLTPELAESFGVKGEKGVLVNRVVPESPAAGAGLRGGDIVIAFAGSRVGGVKEFQKMVAGVSPGSDVEMEILRGGKRHTVTVTLAELERPEERAVPPETPMDAWGLSVVALPKGMGGAMGIAGGVMVREVDRSGPAGEGGVREGDILLRIDRKHVNSPDSYRKLLAGLPHRRMVSVLVGRGGGQLYLAFRNP